uniref:Uncharacterized protein n=1 Tax=Peronospora matthiolae TaxID=2874970 RepID=A0AAV1TWY0_9STRA
MIQTQSFVFLKDRSLMSTSLQQHEHRFRCHYMQLTHVQRPPATVETLGHAAAIKRTRCGSRGDQIDVLLRGRKRLRPRTLFCLSSVLPIHAGMLANANHQIASKFSAEEPSNALQQQPQQAQASKTRMPLTDVASSSLTTRGYRETTGCQ